MLPQSAGADHPADSETLPQWAAAILDLDQTEEGPIWRRNGWGLQYGARTGMVSINLMGSVDPAPY